MRGLTPEERGDLLACWIELWRGVVQAQRAFMDVEVAVGDGALEWTITNAR
ncbi:MAG: hypothetical protein ACMVY4_05480 [Minwuia sp.]|uniref:hypothetical protein n=1 Tax=Minwuia sp. TaxID=2493630 RepID=UPI003A8C1157